MTPNKKYFARVLFKLKVHESNGSAYENLFAQVMQLSRATFTKVAPYGNQGDRGNDGFEKAVGRYFQIYAPQTPQSNIDTAIKKAETDFKSKLIPHWGALGPVKEYFFVFNDKYHGTNYPLEKTLSRIKSSHKLNDAGVFLSSHLEDEFMQLQEDRIMSVIGGLPDENSKEGLDYSVLNEVIKFIQDSPLPTSNHGKLVVPDIDKKIMFNGLKQAGYWLKSKQAETWQVDDYFKRNSNFAKQDLRNHLSALYNESVTAYPDALGQESGADIRFIAILERIAPPTGVPSHDRLRREVGLVVMAKYFETCDIFEEPVDAIAGQTH